MNLQYKLENTNFILKQLTSFDFNLLYTIGRKKKIWAQHPEDDRWKKEKFKFFFDNGLKNEFGLYGIFDKSNNNIIGSTRFYSYERIEKAIRIGFTFFIPEYWGTNANAEIKFIMLDYIFNYIDKVYFDIGKNNIRSRKAIEKIGASLFLDSEKGNVVYILNKKKFYIDFRVIT